MRRRGTYLLAGLLACVPAGCAMVIEGLCENAINSAVHRACGGSSQEREDRESMESYRRSWSTPGRRTHEVETEARGTFRRAHGRDPNLNWHAQRSWVDPGP